jgi:hypothetical protein
MPPAYPGMAPALVAGEHARLSPVAFFVTMPVEMNPLPMILPTLLPSAIVRSARV